MPPDPGPGLKSLPLVIGWKTTAALASALPLSVTRPETRASLWRPPQPRPRSNSTRTDTERIVVLPPGHPSGLCWSAMQHRTPIRASEVPALRGHALRQAGHLTAGDAGQGRQHEVHVDARADRSHRAVAHGEVQHV